MTGCEQWTFGVRSEESSKCTPIAGPKLSLFVNNIYCLKGHSRTIDDNDYDDKAIYRTSILLLRTDNGKRVPS